MNNAILLINDAIVFNFLHSKVAALTGIVPKIKNASSPKDALQLFNEYFIGTVHTRDVLFLELKLPTVEGLEFIDAFRKKTSPQQTGLSIVILLSGITKKDIECLETLTIRHCVNRPPTDDDLRFIIFN
jgi:hypothetical protein